MSCYTPSRITERPQVFSAALLNGTATILGPPMATRVLVPTDLMYYFRSVAGAASARVDYRLSPTGNLATDAADRTRWTDWIVLLNPNVSELLERVAMPTITAPFYQLRVVGLAGNPADSLVDLWVISKEGVLA